MNLIFVLFFLLVVGAMGQMSAYRQMYSSALAPVQAYVASPRVIAPVSPPWPLNNPTAAMQRYLGALSNHDGYISPDAGAHLQSVRNNVRTVVEHANSPNARAYQRGLLAVMEEAGSTAKWEMQTALHPENVRAQHKTALSALSAKITNLLNAVEADTQRLMSQLSEAESERFLLAHELLRAEKQLLNAASRLATSTPHL
ncbi:hypothetical protein L1887_56800 [Cichorium endivia]|nr:hypothetical protein L1887_56800 [Cichorium endivia]